MQGQYNLALTDFLGFVLVLFWSVRGYFLIKHWSFRRTEIPLRIFWASPPLELASLGVHTRSAISSATLAMLSFSVFVFQVWYASLTRASIVFSRTRRCFLLTAAVVPGSGTTIETGAAPCGASMLRG